MADRAPTPRGLAGLGRPRVSALQRCSTHSGRATGGGAPRFLTMKFEVTITVHITFQCKHGVAVVMEYMLPLPCAWERLAISEGVRCSAFAVTGIGAPKTELENNVRRDEGQTPPACISRSLRS